MCLRMNETHCVATIIWLQTLPVANLPRYTFQHVFNLQGVRVGWGLHYGRVTLLPVQTVQPL